jgi:hypothetical protein
VKQSTNIFGFRTIALAVAFYAVCSAGASADKEYQASILSVTGAPIDLTKCEAWARDINKTYLTAHASIPNALFDLGISFVNTSSQPIIAVRLTLTSYDGFNGVIGSSQIDSSENRSADQMKVAPGSSMDLLGPKSWHMANAHADRDHVTCAVTAVKFADGSIWSASDSQKTGSVQPTAPAAAHEPVRVDQVGTTVLAIGKSGSATTDAFTVGSTAGIEWRYDCAKAGSDPSLLITIHAPSGEVPISKNGLTGNGTNYLHEQGTYYLEIRTTCTWQIRVYDGS